MSLTTDIAQVENNLQKLGSEASPYEAHGSLCGLICGRGEIDVKEWIALTTSATEAIEQGDLLAREASESLANFFFETVKALSDNNLEFYPLLPDDDDPVAILAGIAQWSQGFLLGMSLAGVESFTDYPEEVGEFIEAMTSISSADDYDLAGDDSDEEAITELIEFIRIGVLLVNEEMNPIRVPVDIPAEDSDTIH